jgi:hypothetical protein
MNQYQKRNGGFNSNMITSRAELHKIIDLNLPGAEVGVAEGVFSLEILQWGIAKLYLVDVWHQTVGIRGMASEPQENHNQRYEDAKKRLAPYPNAVFLKGLSVKMAAKVPDNSLGFVYIDACHYMEHVTADLHAWVPKLVKGGVCSLHDYGDEGYDVQRAAKKFCHRKYKLIQLPEDGKLENMGAYFIKE